MTAFELIYELSKEQPDDEVVVCVTPNTSARVLGVFRKNGMRVVYLDPDRIELRDESLPKSPAT